MTAIATRPPAPVTKPAYPLSRLLVGMLGRMWLWFVATCLLVTLIPGLFGWNSYVIFSGSMQPNISVGDVVLSSPNPDLSAINGRVITFESPTDPQSILTHRVRAINDDGTLTTRGDANVVDDPFPVSAENVTGMGRLLVQYVGLPLVWASQGNWILVGLFLLSLVGAVIAMLRDQEEDEESHSSVPAYTGSGMTLVLVLALALVPTSSASFATQTINSGNSWATAVRSYTQRVIDHGPYLYWKFEETGTTTAVADASGAPLRPGLVGGAFSRTTGPLVGESTNRALRLGSTSACVTSNHGGQVAAPTTFTIIAWFRADSGYDLGGKLIGFERPQTGVATPANSGSYDRMLYMDGNGRIRFAVYNEAHVVLHHDADMRNGEWHMAAATMSSAGMRLYIDGQLVGSNANAAAEALGGWWRAGCGNLSGWGGTNWAGPNNPGTDANSSTQNRTFQQDLDEITVFNGQALTASQIAELWNSR